MTARLRLRRHEALRLMKTMRCVFAMTNQATGWSFPSELSKNFTAIFLIKFGRMAQQQRQQKEQQQQQQQQPAATTPFGGLRTLDDLIVVAQTLNDRAIAMLPFDEAFLRYSPFQLCFTNFACLFDRQIDIAFERIRKPNQQDEGPIHLHTVMID